MIRSPQRITLKFKYYIALMILYVRLLSAPPFLGILTKQESLLTGFGRWRPGTRGVGLGSPITLCRKPDWSMSQTERRGSELLGGVRGRIPMLHPYGCRSSDPP